MFAQSPLALHVEGDASEKGLEADVGVSVMGQSFSGKVLAGEKELYVNFLGNWYGTTEAGLSQGSGGQQLDQAQALELVRPHLSGLLEGAVTEGPVADGVHTWRVDGKLNGDGLVTLFQGLAPLAAGGATPVPMERLEEQLAEIQPLLDKIHIGLLVGRDDSLLRRFEVTADLSGDDLEDLGASAEELGGFESLSFSLTADVSKYGTKVEFKPPADYQPLEQAFGALFSGVQ
jgi:hypothetical protein